MFNLCDIAPRQPADQQAGNTRTDSAGKPATSASKIGSPAAVDQQQQQQQPPGSPKPEEGEVADDTGSKQEGPGRQKEGARASNDGGGDDQLQLNSRGLNVDKGYDSQSEMERESEARFKARQRARLADLSMLLDVVLKTTSERMKKEWVSCGILTQLQQTVGRLPFTQEYSVQLIKVAQLLDHLPLTPDDLYTARSAHGTFADFIRRMASRASDWEVRQRAHRLLKRYPAASCSDATLMQLYHVPGPNGKPYLLSLHLAPAHISRLLAQMPAAAPPQQALGQDPHSSPSTSGINGKTEAPASEDIRHEDRAQRRHSKFSNGPAAEAPMLMRGNMPLYTSSSMQPSDSWDPGSAPPVEDLGPSGEPPDALHHGPPRGAWGNVRYNRVGRNMWPDRPPFPHYPPPGPMGPYGPHYGPPDNESPAYGEGHHPRWMEPDGAPPPKRFRRSGFNDAYPPHPHPPPGLPPGAHDRGGGGAGGFMPRWPPEPLPYMPPVSDLNSGVPPRAPPASRLARSSSAGEGQLTMKSLPESAVAAGSRSPRRNHHHPAHEGQNGRSGCGVSGSSARHWSRDATDKAMQQQQQQPTLTVKSGQLPVISIEEACAAGLYGCVASNDSSKGSSVLYSPIVHGSFSPLRGAQSTAAVAASGVPMTPAPLPNVSTLGVEDVMAVQADTVIAGRTPGISLLSLASHELMADDVRQHRPQQQQQPRGPSAASSAPTDRHAISHSQQQRHGGGPLPPGFGRHGSDHKYMARPAADASLHAVPISDLGDSFWPKHGTQSGPASTRQASHVSPSVHRQASPVDKVSTPQSMDIDSSLQPSSHPPARWPGWDKQQPAGGQGKMQLTMKHTITCLCYLHGSLGVYTHPC